MADKGLPAGHVVGVVVREGDPFHWLGIARVDLGVQPSSERRVDGIERDNAVIGFHQQAKMPPVTGSSTQSPAGTSS